MPGDLTMPKGPDLSTREGTVLYGAQVFETVEKSLLKLQGDVAKLRPVFGAGPQLGMIGMLQTAEIDAEIRSIVGALAEVERRIFTLHRLGTKIADDHGVDVPQPRGGSPR